MLHPVHMTSAKISGFLTPSLPLVSTNPRNLPSFGEKLANPLPPSQRRRHMYIAPKMNRARARARHPPKLNSLSHLMNAMFPDPRAIALRHGRSSNLSHAGNHQKASARFGECCRQVEAEVVGKSRNKTHQTWPKPSISVKCRS